jgi:hypothetical protein
MTEEHRTAFPTGRVFLGGMAQRLTRCPLRIAPTLRSPPLARGVMEWQADDASSPEEEVHGE